MAEINIGASVLELLDVCRRTAGMLKTPGDLKRYQAIIDRVKPELIIETGLGYGESTRWFARRARRVICVEFDSGRVADYGAQLPNNVTIIEGNSIGEEVVSIVRGMCERGDEQTRMVVLDSDHNTDHVHAEMVAYAPLVTRGSYMVVEDGIFRHCPDPKRFFVFDGGPLDAIERFLREDPAHQWELDEEIQGMSNTTQHLGGWLRRK